MAYKRTSYDDKTSRQICEDIATFLEGCFSVEQKPNDRSLFIPSSGNGWKLWEAVGHRQLRYKWRHSWREKDGKDFTAFDGERQIGRIFRIKELDGRWYWLIATEGPHHLNWPTAGHEETDYLASRRLEMVYENIMSGERRNVA